MLNSIMRYFRYRKLAPVVLRLPFLLARRYGDSEFYTVGQVKRSVESLKIRPALLDTALAIGLAEDDAMAASSSMTPEVYQALRREVVDAFDLEDDDFTTKDLRRTIRLRGLFKGGNSTFEADGVPSMRRADESSGHSAQD